MRVLTITAHPLYAGCNIAGTLYKHAQRGDDVYVVSRDEHVFTTRASQGFNATQVHVVAGTTFGSSSNTTYEAYDGVKPFNTNGDISTPNSTYFARVDTLVSTAATSNICLFLSVADMIDAHDLWKNNGNTKCYNYGAFLGNRYKNNPNVAWIVGNDFQDWETDTASVTALVNILNGIQSADPNHPIYSAWLDYFVSSSRESTVAPHNRLRELQPE